MGGYVINKMRLRDFRPRAEAGGLYKKEGFFSALKRQYGVQ